MSDSLLEIKEDVPIVTLEGLMPLVKTILVKNCSCEFSYINPYVSDYHDNSLSDQGGFLATHKGNLILN